MHVYAYIECAIATLMWYDCYLYVCDVDIIANATTSMHYHHYF